MNCRFCGTPLSDVFLDLGTAPPSNAFLAPTDLARPEIWLPLKLYTCPECFLVQVDEILHHAELFTPDYAYFSSVSTSWLEHSERYVDLAVSRLGLDSASFVVEVASNDGYLLQYVDNRGISCVGIEPTSGTAEAARAKGIETIEQFFGVKFAHELAAERGQADLIIANNVLAHVPDINDFVGGFQALLAPNGVVTIEFPHLYEMVAQRQFDTVYHEHFSYFSFTTVRRVLAAHGLRAWDVERIGTHGGSLRIWACHERSSRTEESHVGDLLALEAEAGFGDMAYYGGFQSVAERVKNDFMEFLLDAKRTGKRVVGYGAAAKGNTLLNFAGVRSDLVSFIVDASPRKQGTYMPGSRIAVVDESLLRSERPDYIVVFPWNLRAEITEQLSYVREWGAHLVFAIPQLTVE